MKLEIFCDKKMFHKIVFKRYSYYILSIIYDILFIITDKTIIIIVTMIVIILLSLF